jgi:hypothetical protein
MVRTSSEEDDSKSNVHGCSRRAENEEGRREQAGEGSLAVGLSEGVRIECKSFDARGDLDVAVSRRRGEQVSSKVSELKEFRRLTSRPRLRSSVGRPYSKGKAWYL